MKFEATLYLILASFSGYCLIYGAPEGTANYATDTYAILLAVFWVGSTIISKLNKKGG